jgi:hypothetical protein
MALSAKGARQLHFNDRTTAEAEAYGAGGRHLRAGPARSRRPHPHRRLVRQPARRRPAPPAPGPGRLGRGDGGATIALVSVVNRVPLVIIRSRYRSRGGVLIRRTLKLDPQTERMM